ncbi:hypothetical protein ScPMuIL_009389 [Solemya velum]
MFVDHGTDFSLTRWLQTNELDVGASLDDYYSSKLLGLLGLGDYLLDTPCQRTASPYSPAVDNWTNSCPLEDLSLSLDGPLTCHLQKTCTAVECCVEVTRIRRSFNVFLSLDPCEARLKIGIEKMTYDLSLIDYEFDVEEHFLLLGVIRVDFSIVDLSAEEEFLVNMELRVCFDNFEDCQLKVTVFENTRLPKTPCDWSLDFSVPDFSLLDWQLQNGYPTSGQLSEVSKFHLLEHLGIAGYLSDTPCVLQDSSWSFGCNKSVSTAPLPSSTTCVIPDSCTAVDCCTNIDRFTGGMAVRTYVEIDPCAFTLKIGIENIYFIKSLVKDQLETEEHFSLGGLARLSVSVEDFPSMKQYALNMKIEVCFESSSECYITVTVFDGTMLPKRECDFKTPFSLPGFHTLNGWLVENHYTAASQLPHYVVSRLLEDLGVSMFLWDTSCELDQTPYSLSQSSWNKDECASSGDIVTPQLPDFIVCYLPSSCMEIDCCLRVDLIGHTFRTVVKLDPCNFVLHLEIERLVWDYSLFDYEWGEYNVCDIWFLFSSYNIMNLEGERKFLVNVKMSVCFEEEDCIHTTTVAYNMELPKPSCDWESEFNIPGFSLTSWKIDQETSDDLLPDLLVSRLLEDLGVAAYLDFPSCTASEAPYTSDPGADGTCADVTMPNLPNGVSCYILGSCSGVQCCMEVEVIQRPISALLSIDTCNLVLTVGFDKFVYTKHLFEFGWGMCIHHRVDVYYRLSLMDLIYANGYMVNLRVGACFESGEDACTDNLKDVLINEILPKEECAWDRAFLDNEFSTDTWMTTRGFPADQKLSDELSSMFLEELGVAQYLATDRCQIGEEPFDVLGDWTKSCAREVVLVPLEGPVSCHLGESCTDVTCCVIMERLGQTAQIKLSLDPCNEELTVGIENFIRMFNLDGYDWGRYIKLYSTFTRYKIEDFPDEGVYIVSMSAVVCYESGVDGCPLTFEIMKNLKLWKPPCDWNKGFKDPDFELETWGSTWSINVNEELEDYAITLLEETLGLSKYLQAPQCSAHPAAGDDGWDISECSESPTLVPLSASLTCKMLQSCTGVECCVEVGLLKRNVNVKVALDPCLYTLTLAIDNLEVKQTLFDFQWVVVGTVCLQFCFSYSYTISDLTVKGSYLISLRVLACFGEDACRVEEWIFQNVMLPKQSCIWNNGFIDGDFSLATLIEANDVSSTDPIPGYVFSQMAKQLEISRYLETQACKHGTNPFSTFDGNWNNDCMGVSVPELLDQDDLHVVCHLDDQCSRIQCCVDVVQLARTFLLYIHLDTCQNQLEVGIEKFYRTTLLTEYNHGVDDSIFLGGLVRMTYRIDVLGFRESLVSAKVQICLDAAFECELEVTLLDNVLLPQHTCEFSQSDFSLNEWKAENGITEDPLPPFATALLFENLDMSRFLKAEECNRDEFVNSGCSETIDRPEIIGPVSCHMLIVLFHNTGCSETIDRPEITGPVSCHMLIVLFHNTGCSETIDRPEITGSVSCHMLIVLFHNTGCSKTIDRPETTGPVSCHMLIVLFHNTGCSETIDRPEITGPRVVSHDAPRPLTDQRSPAHVSCHMLIVLFHNTGCSETIDRPEITGPVSCHMLIILFHNTGCSKTIDRPEITGPVSCHMLIVLFHNTGCSETIDRPEITGPMSCHLLIFLFHNTGCSKTIDRPEITGPVSCHLLIFLFHNTGCSKTIDRPEITGPVSCHMLIVLFHNTGCSKTIDRPEITGPVSCHMLIFLFHNTGCSETIDRPEITGPVSCHMLIFLFHNTGCSETIDRPEITGPVSCHMLIILFHNTGCSKTIDRPEITGPVSCHMLIVLFHNTGCSETIDRPEITGPVSCHLLIFLFHNTGCSETIDRPEITGPRCSKTIDRPEITGPVSCHLLIFLFHNTGCSKTIDRPEITGPVSCHMLIVLFHNTGCSKTIDRPEITGPVSCHMLIVLFHNTGCSKTIDRPEITGPVSCHMLIILFHNTGCSETIDRPEITGPVSCHMSTCTAIDCCMDFLDRTINFHLSIDPCSARLSIGVENLKEQIIMGNFGFEKTDQLYLGDIVTVEYSVVDLYASESYLVYLAVRVCFENSTDCNETETVLDHTLLPKPTCQWDTGYLIQDFSLADWKSDNAVSGDVSGYLTSTLLRDIGIGDYLLDQSCDRKSLPYGQTEFTWSSECDKEIVNIFNVTGDVSCHFSETCYSVSCCLESGTIGQTFTVTMEINPCSQRLSVAIEKFSYSVSLIGYEWGKEEKINLQGLVRMKLTVDRLLSQSSYLVDMTISLCYESSQSCDQELVIFDQSKLPILSCDLTIGFIEEDFSLSEWETGAKTVGGALTPVSALHLQHVLGVADFMENVCTVDTPGWTDDCSQGLTQGELPEAIQCHMTSKCTEVDCCIRYEHIHTSFHTYFYFNPCDFKLTVRIEKLDVEIPLFDFDFGEPVKISLKGVASLDFIIEEPIFTDTYIIHLNASLCFESSGDCVVDTPILKDTVFNKQECDWTTGFKQNDFSFSQWLVDETISGVSAMSELQKDKLLQDLGLVEYLSTDQCQFGAALYSSKGSWNDECQSLDVEALGADLACYIPADCSGVRCCVDAPAVGRSFEASFHLNMCELSLNIQLERLLISYSLLNYVYGVTEDIRIHGVFRMSFTIYNNGDKFTIDLTLRVCYESASSACDVVADLFQSMDLPYPACPENQTDFFSESSCPAAYYDLSNFTEHNCEFKADCQTLICCAPMDLYKGYRNVYFTWKLDMCGSSQVEVGIEGLEWTKAVDITNEEVLEFGQVFKMTYIVQSEPSETYVTYNLTASFTACGLYSMGGGCSVFELGSLLNKCATPPPAKRRKRAVDVNSIDVLTLKDGIRLLQEQAATDTDINTFVKQWQAKEKEAKESNLQGVEIDPSEKTVGYRTALDALGSSDPTTLAFSDDSKLQGSVTIQGSDAIGNMFDDVKAIAGRANQIFVVGEGLTPAGGKLLGEKLANMTLGDLEAMLDMKNLDPELLIQFTLELRDLCRALYSELIEALLTGGLVDEFKSFDLTLTGSFGFPETRVILFEYSYFMVVGGLIPMTFGFGAGGYYGMDFTVGAKVLNMQGNAGVVPYGGLTCYGELGVGAVLYGKLRLEGKILDLRFPTVAEITFSKFPLDVGLIMDLKLTPVKIALYALVTLEVDLKFTSFTKTLFKAKLFSYATATITKRMVDTTKNEKDDSPPEFSDFTDKAGEEKKSTQECFAEQLPGRDYTEPEFEVSFQAEDDRSQVELLLDIGTVPGGSDTLKDQELGGPSTIVKTVLKHTGVPLYLTVTGTNDAGGSATISCTLPSYDVTVPSGRFTTAFTLTSNPEVLRASVVVFEDSILAEARVGVGYSEGMFGDTIVPWYRVDLTERTTEVTSSTGNTLEYFTLGRGGRLIGAVFYTESGVVSPGDCAQKCLNYGEKKCLSFNYDFSPDTICELLEAIEGFDFMIAESGLFSHYERLGVGHAVEFSYEDLSLEHNELYYFNMDLYNYLGYQNIISTAGILADFTPPQPGFIQNGVSDVLKIVDCLDVIPDDRTDWEPRCVGVHEAIHNHRVIIDGPGSMTVFHGLEPLVDLLYTRANRHVTANWDGFHDDETGIFGYSWAVGHKLCEEMIHPHHDPHKHLLDETQWTHYGMIHPIPEPYQILADGKYYISVTALNKVQYGGPLSTTVCHSTPLSVDNSPPEIYEIFNIQYDEVIYELFMEYNASDPHSDIAHVDLCLGFTTRTCDVLEYERYTAGTNITHFMPTLPNGRPIWIKLRAVNYVDLRTIKVSDQPIIIDNTAPIAGNLYDGPVFQEDLQFTKDRDLICSNWEDFYDEESGISFYLLGVGTEPDTTDIADLMRVDRRVHQSCVELEEENYLEHGKTYYNVLYAFNGGHKRLNVSASSDGVKVDLTKPVPGEIVDGNSPSFEDMEFTAAKATVAAQWRGYSDPESYIREYKIKVMKAENLTEDFVVLKDWTSFNNQTEDVIWRNFHLQHRDRIKVVLETVNGALNSVENETDGFVVDLTPPKLLHLGDGLTENSDIEYQSQIDSLSANFKFIDEESGLDHFKFQVFQHSQGSKHQIHPGTSSSWKEVEDPSLISFTEPSLTLTSGARYSVRVGAVNRAGFVAAYDTNGVIVDISPPKIHWVRVGVLSGLEETVDQYVWQSDNQGIKAMWLATDSQSDIKAFSVAVGTSEGGTDVLAWTDVGEEPNRYISDLVLELTDQDTEPMGPVYYVSVKAENGAGLFSEPMTSTPIVVVAKDRAGVAIDGADGSEDLDSDGLGIDLDFQADTNTVTVQFRGFESELHGVMSYDWAVGTEPGMEDIQPFMEAGIVHREEEDVAGEGLSSSGYAQAVLSLVSGQTYYTTVRAVTNAGAVLETVTDGLTVDTSPPVISLDSVSEEVSPYLTAASSVLYQSSTDTLSALWHYNDSEASVQNAWYSVGTVPFGQEVWTRQEVGISPNLISSVDVGQILPDTTGTTLISKLIRIEKPNIFNIWVRNAAGLTSKLSSASVIVDTTEPVQGSVVCPSFAVSHSAVECTWTGFFDEESPIVKFYLTVGTSAGSSDVLDPVEIPGTASRYTIQGLDSDFKHGHTYFVMITAENAVGLTSSAFSEAINIDDTPPRFGKVIELASDYRLVSGDDAATVALNNHMCGTDSECDVLDAECQESLSTVAVAWQPFIDEESDIQSYHLAVGTTPGGGQVQQFFKVPTAKTNHIITGLILKGLSKVYVSVKGVNGAGLTSVTVSDGVYMSYLSQGLPPLYHVGIWDSEEQSTGDINFQTDRTTIMAAWDVSGDPCPVVKYEWAVERMDGLTVQEFVDTEGQTSRSNDELEMNNEERYFSLLRVTNALGYQYTLRSDGVTVLKDPLRPGQVFVGHLVGFDLDFQPFSHTVSANWNGFGADSYEEQAKVITGNDGLQTDTTEGNQEVAYYEVALGTDRRFTKTRDNIVPYTNMGLNTTVTFYNLELVPGTATYYFTVRAYSTSSSVAEVTSNGFYVGYDGGVSGGSISMRDYVNSDTTVDILWDGFTSEVELMLNFVAISDNTDANSTDCRLYVDGGLATDEQKAALFNVSSMTNVGKDTYVEITDLKLTQGATYYAWVIVTDQAGECQMVVHEFTVDITPPELGRMRAGIYFDMAVSYTQQSDRVGVWWENYGDPQSGIQTYEVSLRKYSSCAEDGDTETVVDWLTLDPDYTEYTFVDLNLQPLVPHYVYLRVTNWAGLTVTKTSSPVLYDLSEPTPGRVVDGDNFLDDVVWSGEPDVVKGVILHLADPSGSSCPSRQISVYSDPGWRSLVQKGFLDPSGLDWKLEQRAENVLTTKEGDNEEVTVKITRDSKSMKVFTGAYTRSADFVQSGTYQVNVKAAGGEGKAVTGIMFWDGPEDGIAVYNHVPEADWTADLCACCTETLAAGEVCLCNCTEYLAEKEFYDKLREEANITETEDANDNSGNNNNSNSNNSNSNSNSNNGNKNNENSNKNEDKKNNGGNPWDVFDPDEHDSEKPVNNSIPLAQRSCGIQLYSGEDSKLVTWCRVFNDTLPPQFTTVPLLFDPSEDFHNVRLVFDSVYEESTGLTKCLFVFIDDEKMTEICGISNLLSSTQLVFHTWSKNNVVPEITDMFNIWTARAIFKDLIMPPALSALCRYGNPFRGGTNPIIRYEAGIGTERGLTDVIDFRKVLGPCQPCLDECSSYSCDFTCQAMSPTLQYIQLEDLNLNATNPNSNDTTAYYLTVKAVLGSGASVTASSDGFYIDLTPPTFDWDVMMYIDVTQAAFKPTDYQASNSTIKALWNCEDPESEITEYLWAIGITEGGEELQPFQSTGTFPTGLNDTFTGILEHNGTYFVSVICINGAGLSKQFNFTKGVTAQLEPPLADDVTAAVVGAEKFDVEVFPKNAMKSKNPSSIGASWTVGEDEFLRRYEVCVGSSEAHLEDIFQCTWVGYNVSGYMEIKNGNLLINGTVIHRLSELKPPDFNTTTNDTKLDENNVFLMEVGRTLFIKMKLCNEADLCLIREVADVVITGDQTAMATSENGTKVDVTVNLPDGADRRKRATHSLTVETPDGLLPGQSIMVNVLTRAELEADYRSDASTEFTPYIVNPALTLDLTDRWLTNRIHSAFDFFTVVSVGQLEVPGPLVMRFPSYTSKSSQTDVNITTLVHWNPVAGRWEQSSKSCEYEEETEVWDREQGVVTVKVCDTWTSVPVAVAEPLTRRRRATPDSTTTTEVPRPTEAYFSAETQFGLAIISESIPNTPPVLVSQTNVTINEEEAFSYQLIADDNEGDPVMFSLDAGYTGAELGELSLSGDGLLVYTPYLDLFGEENVPIILTDNPEEIPPATSRVTITITVEDVTDVPVIFLTSMGQSILLADPTEPVNIYIEQQSDVQPNPAGYAMLLGAYDVDIPDSLTVVMEGPYNGTWQIGTEDTSIPETDNCPAIKTSSSFPCGELQLPHPPSTLTWKYVSLRYDQVHAYYGVDTVKMYIEDSKGGVSDVLTVNFVVMEFPCQNDGSCSSLAASVYSCQDLRRAESFDQYYNCSCPPGYVGQYCETDFDECSSSPCDPIYICIDGVNSYICECPPSDPDCDRLPLWAIFLIVFACILIIVIIVACYCLWKKKRERWEQQHYSVRKRRSSSTSSSLKSDGFAAEHFNRGFLEDDFQGYLQGDLEMIGFSNNPPFVPPMSTLYSDRLNPRLPTPVTPADVEALETWDRDEETRRGSTGLLPHRKAWNESSTTPDDGRSRSNSTSSYKNTRVKDLTHRPSPTLYLKQLFGHRGSSSSDSDNGRSLPKSQKDTKTKTHLDHLDKRRMERLTNPDNPSIQPALLQQMIDQNKKRAKPDPTHLGKGNGHASDPSRTPPEPRPDYEKSHLPGRITSVKN